MSVDVSIVIVSYNARAYLEKCLMSVRQNAAGVNHEVFVVDNASSDASADLVAESFPEVNLIRNPNNDGFAAANNLAIRKCSGEFVFLLNNDTELLPECLEKMLSFARKTSDCGVVGCRLIGADGKPQGSAKRFKTALNHLWGYLPIVGESKNPLVWASYDLSFLSQTEATPVDYVCGAAMLIKKAVLDKVGLLDEHYFMYSEEEDLCYQLKSEGWLTYYLSTATTIHYGGSSSKTCFGRMNREFHKSQIIFMRKNHGRVAELLFRVMTIAAIIMGVAGKTIVWIVKRDRSQSRRQIRTMLDALTTYLAPNVRPQNGSR